MVKMDWFYQDHMLFIDFAKLMLDKPDELYSSDFVNFTLTHFWGGIKTKIIIWRVLPSILSLLMQIWHFYDTLSYVKLQQSFDELPIETWSMNILCIIMRLYALWSEVS